MRQLTIRQSAVLAAVERRRECSLLDLRCDFPDLAPSAVWLVIDSLSCRGLVNRAGDFERVFSAACIGEGGRERSV